MAKYIVYFSTGEIFEQDSSSSSRLYQRAKSCLRFTSAYSGEYASCICKRCNPVEKQHDTPIWVMTNSSFDGLEFSRWGTNKAHVLLARQIFLFNSNADSDWIDRLFDRPKSRAKRFSLDDGRE